MTNQQQFNTAPEAEMLRNAYTELKCYDASPAIFPALKEAIEAYAAHQADLQKKLDDALEMVELLKKELTRDQPTP